MTTSNWISGAIQELKQNRAKAAALLVVLMIAGYFWLPVVRRWWSRSRDGQPPIAPVTSVKGEIADEPEFNWEKYQTWVKGTLYMQPRLWPVEHQDPFDLRADTAMVQATGETPTNETSPVELTPENAGVVLRGTLCTPKGRWANFNGELYREGQTIEVRTAQGQTSYRIVAISLEHVDLERDGRWYRVFLDVPRQASTARIWIDRVNP